VVRLVPRAEPLACDAAALQRITEAAFGQRRKMLRQSLKGAPGALAALESVGIDPQRRAETLSAAEFVAITRTLTT
jgi:16S rRNA (adenine1518-N6/adenine1519-N6)-dimethyltransferase